MDRKSWRDRMIDTLLEEELGAEEFPDLTSSVMAKWDEELESQAEVAKHESTNTSVGAAGVLASINAYWKWSAASAAVLIIGLGFAMAFYLTQLEVYPEAELAGGLKIVAVDSGTELQRQQVLRTGEQSGSLKLGGYAEVEVAAHSEIRWQGAPNAVIVELLKGSVINRVDKEREGTFEVITAHGRVQTVGTIFEVHLVEEGEGDMKFNQMIVKVMVGSVLVTGSFGQEVVNAGDEKSFSDQPLQQHAASGQKSLDAQAKSQDKADKPQHENLINTQENDQAPKALKRLGSAKFNPVESEYKDLTHFAISPDNKMMAAATLSQNIHVWELETGRLIKRLSLGGFLRELRFSPDGNYLAGNIARGDMVVYRVKDWQQIAQIPRRDAEGKPSGNITQIAFSPNSQQIAASTNLGYVWVLDIETNEVIQKLKGYRQSEPLPNGRGLRTHILSHVSYRSDGKALVVACLDQHLRIFNTVTWKLEKTIKRETHTLNGVQYFDEDRKLVWFENGMSPIGSTGSIYVYDFQTGSTTTLLESHSPAIYDMQVSPKETQLALIDGDGRLLVLDLETKELVYQEQTSITKIVKQRTGIRGSFIKGLGLSFSQDGKRLYASAEFTVIPRVIDTQTWKEIYPYNAHIWKIHSLAFNQAQDQLVSKDVSGLTQIWNLNSAESIGQKKRRVAEINHHYSKDGRLYVKVDEENRNTSLELVESQGNRTRFSFSYKGLMLSNQFSPDLRHLAITTRDFGDEHWFYLLDVKSGEVIYQQAFKGEYQYSFGASGQLLAIAGMYDRGVQEESISVIDLRDDARVIFLKHIPVHKGINLVLSPDGFILGYQGNGTRGIILWDLVTGGEIGKLNGFNEWGLPGNLIFDHKSGQLFFSNRGKLWIYDAYSREKIHHYKKTDGKVTTANFSPDGQSLATAHESGTILLWKTGRPQAQVNDTSESLDKLWAAAINNTELAQAYLSIGKLIDQGDETVAFLKSSVTYTQPQDTKKIVEQIVKDLASEDANVRDQAKKRLDSLGAEAWASVQKAHQDAPSLDIRMALEAWLKESQGVSQDSRVTAEKRAVQILEAIRTKEAIAVLEAWSKSENASALKIQALAAMERIHSKK